MDADTTTQHDRPEELPEDRPLSPGQRQRLGELLRVQAMHPCERATAILLREGFSLRQIGASLCMTGRRLREIHESLSQRADLQFDRPDRDRRRSAEVTQQREKQQITKQKRGV